MEATQKDDGMSPEECEIRDWCLSLHCTVDELREAVKAVGCSADAVQKYLLAKQSSCQP